MAKLKLQGHASGTGVFTLSPPNSSTDRTITLPDSSGALLTDGSTIGTSQIADDAVTTDKLANSINTKLDGIEANADVTDATNVTAAGALMDSECTSLADVKAINQSLVTTASPTFATLNATTVDLGDWTITESSGVLYFATGGTNKMKLDASGNLTCVGDVTANGSM